MLILVAKQTTGNLAAIADDWHLTCNAWRAGRLGCRPLRQLHIAEPRDQSTTGRRLSTLKITFDQTVLGANLPSNFRLTSRGVDQAFDTSDRHQLRTNGAVQRQKQLP